MYFCKKVYANFLFLILVSFLFAKLEIEIEGDKGWASELPTWKKKLMGGFVLTGYHLFLWLFLLIIFHLPFLFLKWSLTNEYFVLSFLFSFLLLEDAFWFFFHNNFKNKKDDWRDPKILGVIPYFFFIASGIALFTAWKTGCKTWTRLIVGLMGSILISYPFQVSSSEG